VPLYYSIHQIWWTTVAIKNLAISNWVPFNPLFSGTDKHLHGPKKGWCIQTQGDLHVRAATKRCFSSTSWHFGPMSYLHAIHCITYIDVSNRYPPGSLPLITCAHGLTKCQGVPKSRSKHQQMLFLHSHSTQKEHQKVLCAYDSNLS